MDPVSLPSKSVADIDVLVTPSQAANGHTDAHIVTKGHLLTYGTSTDTVVTEQASLVFHDIVYAVPTGWFWKKKEKVILNSVRYVYVYCVDSYSTWI